MRLALPSGRTLTIGLLTVIAAVAVASASLGTPLAKLNPFLAESVAPYNGYAVARKGELMMRLPAFAGKPELAQVQREALLLSPLQFSASRNLGFIALLGGDRAASRQWLALTGRGTLREPYTHLMLMNLAFERRDNPTTVREAEILLRQNRVIEKEVFEVLTNLVDRGDMIATIAARLAENPAWRGGFLATLGDQGKNFPRELKLFRLLDRSPYPPRKDELDVWLLKQADKLPPSQLWEIWRELLPRPLSASEQLLRDGDFGPSDLPRPFTWNLYVSDNGYAEREDGPDSKNPALYTEYRGNRPLTLARQMLALRPGSYRVAVRAQPTMPVEQGLIRLRVSCDGGATLLELKPGRAPVDRWTTISGAFKVPASCPAQSLTFDGFPQPGGDLEQVYFDDVRLTPASPLA